MKNNRLKARFFRPLGERLEERLNLSGVTVITHGALLSLGGLVPFPTWPIAMGEAILDQADGGLATRSTGSIYIHDQTTGAWKAPSDPGQSTWNNSNAADEEIVLVYVWQAESLSQVTGTAEAAADDLFASLFQVNTNLGGAIANQRFIDFANPGNGDLDLHFIGHSRGTIVNTLVAERFANYFPDWTIDQITSLDSHPAKISTNPFQADAIDPYYQANEATTRLPTFTNVSFADTYYRTDPVYQPSTLDFSGVPVDGAYNVNLTPVLETNPGNNSDNPLTTFDNNGFSLEHSDVHLWYQSTIQNTGTISDGEISNFDPTAAGWFQSLDRSATGFAYSRIAADASRPAPISAKTAAQPLRTTIFNGDFALGSDGLNTIPGWEFHGGAHDADLSSGAVILGNGFLGIDRDFIRHNPFYIPATSDTLAFDYQVTATSSRDRLEILIADTLIDVPPVSVPGSFHREVVIPDRYRNAANTLEFRIRSTTDLESAIRLDNVALLAGANVDFRVKTFDVVVEPAVSGQSIATTYEILNDGNRAATVKAQWYLSRDTTITTSDRPLGTEEVVVLSAGATTGQKTATLTLPQARDPIWAGDGTYYVGMILDPQNQITETSEANNANQGDSIDSDALLVSNATGPVSIVTCGSGFVYSDFNGDDNFTAGIDDSVPQTVVKLLSASDRSVVATTQSSDTGFYEFPNAPAGNYILSVVRPAAFGTETSPELAVTIVHAGNCNDANIDLGRLESTYTSPRLFLASNRIGTASRTALLKEILDRAEADRAPQVVNGQLSSVSPPSPTETIIAASDVPAPLASPVAEDVAAAETSVFGPVPSDRASEGESTNEVITKSLADDECELDFEARAVLQSLTLSSTEESADPDVQNSEPDSPTAPVDEPASPTVLIFGPDAPARAETFDVDSTDQVFARIDSLLEDCELS